MFELLGVYVAKDGRCLFGLQIEYLRSEHLMTGLLTALNGLYREIYGTPLRTIELNSTRIKIIPVEPLELIILYEGEGVEQFQQRLIEEVYLNKVIDTNVDIVDEIHENAFAQIVTEIMSESWKDA